MADIRLWRNRVAAPAYRLRSSWQRRINRFKRNKTRELTLREDTFKKAEIRWQEESIARSRLEQRLLFLEFAERGWSRTKDIEERPGLLLSEGTDAGAEDGSDVMHFSEPPPPGEAFAALRSINVWCQEWLTGLSWTVQTAADAWQSQLWGKKTGKKFTFEIDVASGERLSAIECYQGHMIGKLRFITNRDRQSEWYGQYTVGRFTRICADPSKSFDDAYIVGFCGSTTRMKSLSGLGAIVRYNDEASLFSNCWTSKVGRDESQFATLMRMRQCDIQAALKRSKLFVRRILSSSQPGMPEMLRKWQHALALGKWHFQSLCHGLPELKNDDGQGEVLLERGSKRIREGEEMIASARKRLSEIPEFRRDGKHAIRDAIIGPGAARKIREKIAALQAEILDGEKVIQSGRKIVHRAREILPNIRMSRPLKRYFESLYDLSVLADSLGKDAYRPPKKKSLAELERDDEAHNVELAGTKAKADLQKLQVVGGDMMASALFQRNEGSGEEERVHEDAEKFISILKVGGNSS